MRAGWSRTVIEPGSGAQRGFTLVETIIVLTVLVFLVSVMANLIINTSNTQKYIEQMARCTEVNQEIINDLRGEILTTVTLFESGTVGDGYFKSLIFDATSPPLGSSGLATLIPNDTFQKETVSGALAGNVLMFAGQARTDEFTCASGNTYRIDIYRLYCYYLTKEDGGPKPGTPTGLNLSKFVSEPMADGDQIDAMTDPVDKTEVLGHLHAGSPDDSGEAHAITLLVWRRGRDIAILNTMREIDSSGLLSSTPIAPRPAGAWKINREPTKSHRGLLHYRHFSIATNYGDDRLGVARFSKMSMTGDGFPHGFEVQIAGPSSARQVLVHISVVGTNRKGTKPHSDLRATVFVQDV
jgi:prepilin-type N-terminal cleavage/methylation domain-containing protein